MSDDDQRRGRDEDDFGSLFGDDPVSDTANPIRGLSIEEGDTGPLPHWSEPPTGEMPRLTPREVSEASAEADVWGSFDDEGPMWSDEVDRPTGVSPVVESDPTGGGFAPVDDFASYDPTTAQPVVADPSGAHASGAVRREPGRITIGTDPTGGEHRPSTGQRRRPGDPGRPHRRSAPSRTAPPASGRDMPTAVGVGLALAAIFVGAVMWKAVAVLVIVIIVLGLAAVEFYDKVSEKGYQPAIYIGVAASVAMPIATWWHGLTAMVLVLFLAFAAICATYIAGPDVESNPLPNVAITTVGVVWIGFMGSFGALILTGSKGDHVPIGKDTLFLVVLGVVANDVGALFTGSTFGRTPLRRWISPNKTVEGLVGGTIFTFVAMLVVGLLDRSMTWNSQGDLLLLAIVIAIAAPLGDLTESMFKRNLDIKDFGTLVRGHGGVLDRFDGFLFTLPAVYFLLTTLQPWVS